MQQDIFNLSEDDFKEEQKRSSLSDIYAPNPKDAPDSVYKAILRFIPNPADTSNSIVRKVVHWLSEGDSGFYVDCPSSIGERSPCSDAYWKLKKSSSAYDQKQSEMIGRKEYHYSYVYVVKDFQNPDLDGTVQVFRYPKTIRRMISDELTPDAMQLERGVEPCNVFDLFRGKDFLFKVGLKGGFRNYDACEFATERTAIQINGVRMKPDAESREAIMKVYAEKMPASKIEDHAFKPWTSEQTERVNAFLTSITGDTASAVSAVTSPRKAPTARDQEVVGQDLVTEKAETNEAEAEDGDAPSSELDAWLAGK